MSESDDAWDKATPEQKIQDMKLSGRKYYLFLDLGAIVAMAVGLTWILVLPIWLVLTGIVFILKRIVISAIKRGRI